LAALRQRAHQAHRALQTLSTDARLLFALTKITMNPSAVPIPLSRAPQPDPFVRSRYRSVEQLTESRTGALYVIEHVELGKRFVAKVLHSAQLHDATVVDRLRLEAQSLGRLRHPNIVGITGFEYTEDGRPFIVMEHLRGNTLAQRLSEDRQLPLGDVLDWVRQVTSALDAAHAIGIVHRNVCPENVFLHRTASGSVVPKLLNFGSARVISGISERAPAPLAVPTKTGAIVGAPEFSSPELAQGRKADARSDIYQLGRILDLMLTGRGAVLAVESDPRSASPTASPSRYASPKLPPELDQLVMKALAQDPGNRYQSAAEMGQALQQLAQSTAVLSATPRADRAKRVLLFLGLAALAATLVLGAAMLLDLWR